MALPKINETLNFNMTIPSTGQRVKYRPYLVKEEKILLQAFESKDMHMCLSAMADTLNACVDPKANLNVEQLATFDIEFMFTQLRSKSVGETSTIMISCTSLIDGINPKRTTCGEQNEYTIDLDQLSVSAADGGNVVVITPEISVEMKYPTYETMIREGVSQAEEKKSTNVIELLASCIGAVLTQDERIDSKNESLEDMIAFVDNMTANQLKVMTDFLENMPALKHNAEFECTKCGSKNAVELKGLSDFF